MSKIKLNYKTAMMKDSKTKEVIADRRRPYIVGLRIYNLDELVKFALDNNYIEGAKYELAKGIVKGAIEAERALVLAGNAVSIDGWVKYEPRLKGSVAAGKRTLTKDNALDMGISALKEMKLSLDTFSWQLVDEGFTPDPDPEPTPTPTGDEPVVTSGHSSGYGDAGMIDPNADFIMEGRNLAGASVKVDWTDEGGNERTLNVPAGEVEAEDESITLQQGDWLEACTTADGAVLTFTVTTSHGSTTYNATVRA